MEKISHIELQKFFDNRNQRANELLETFSSEVHDKNPNQITNAKIKALKESNDEMLISLLDELNLLK